MSEAEITQLKTRNVELRDNLAVGRRLTVGNDATFEDDVEIKGILNVGRPASFNDRVNVNGSVSLGGALLLNRDDVSGERWCRAATNGRLTCNHNIPAPEFRLTLGSSGGCPVVNLQQRSGSWQTVSSITLPCEG